MGGVAALTADLRERIRRLDGMERLLPALDGLPPTYLVGGAVRDLLRGAVAVDLDIAVEGDSRSVARALAERLGGSATVHERFGTATVRTPEVVFDLAATRTETYAEPGALPDVAPAGLVEDLRRRDFSVNAMALALAGDDLGHLYDPSRGLRDLEAGVIRTLHSGSFLDDPTRLLRAVRYETRLGFQMDEPTERAARAAIAEGAMSTVSGARVRDELMDLLAELKAPRGVERMTDLGLDRASARVPRSRPRACDVGLTRRAGNRRRPRAGRAGRTGCLRARGARPLGRGPAARRPRPRRGVARGARGRADRDRAARRTSTPRPSCRLCSGASRPRPWPSRWPWAPRRSRCCSGPPT